MSKLLELSPELIEHIFLFEQSVRQELEDEDGHGVAVAPFFRLTNRYIEGCTRRMFAKTYFRTRRIRTSDDASIRKFRDMAQSPELIKYVSKLDSYVTEDHHGGRGVSLVTRNNFVDALRAYSAMRVFVFCGAPREEADDLHQEDRTVGDFEVTACRNVFDMSSSFGFVLFVAEEAGIRPTSISTMSCDPFKLPHCGLADCSALAQNNAIVGEVKQLAIDIIPLRLEHGVIPENMGIRLVRKLKAGHSNMPALKSLELSFHTGSTSGLPAWDILANVPKLLNMEELILQGCNMNLRDMARFVLKQADTLKYLDLSTLYLHNGTLTDMSVFYAQLSIVSSIEENYQEALGLPIVVWVSLWVRYIGLPSHLCALYITEGENEDGYIGVSVLDETIHWKRCQEVKDMLSYLAVCLF